VIPVRKPEIWEQQSVKNTLVEMLQFLTEDRFEFVFTRREALPEQLVFEQISEELPPCPEADCVTLFSGGMDSFAGAVHLVAKGQKPLLVSHHSRPVLVGLQHSLASPLRQRLSSWEFPYIGVWINRIGPRAVENSQRSRSFLFLALGSLLAHQLKLNELVVCENGITTFNLPRLGQVTGAQATRSTHPRFIRLFRDLASEVFGVDFKIETPFVWKTRSEIIDILKENNCEDFLQLSSSCAHSQRTKMHPGCGVCSQCVDRRFAVTHAGLDKLEVDRYEKNIFTDALEEGIEKAQAFSAVQFALNVRRLDDLASFCREYPEVFDAVDNLPGNPNGVLDKIYQLHWQYAAEVVEVMRKVDFENWERKANRDLPDTCLIMLVNSTSQRPHWMIAKTAEELTQKLYECPISEIKPFEVVCEEVLTFLFCEDLPRDYALSRPNRQSKTDQGYKRRDLLFPNQATKGLWASVRQEYSAVGIIADAKNYESEIDGDTVNSFASKYLKKHGIGQFGILVARKVPADTIAVTQDRPSGAVEAQKEQWRDNENIVVLLGISDLVEMLRMKADGQDPTTLLNNRIFTLRSRM
jgi:7-cyano-7-deazaguanine synthase in queuosine biosynthesis